MALFPYNILSEHKLRCIFGRVFDRIQKPDLERFGTQIQRNRVHIHAALNVPTIY